MSKQFYSTYYWDADEVDADLDADFDSYCYLIWSNSDRPQTCPWPLDIYEWTYIWSIDDIWTALEREIPKEILHDFYSKHREDYSNEETYCKINLRHYYRLNHDLEVYSQEEADDLKKNEESVLQTSYILDDALWVERGTSFNSMKDQW